MCVYLRFIGIASLLIGLQLFTPKLVETRLGLGQINNISSNASFVASSTKGSQKLALTAHSSKVFQPPDRGGPDITRGSGTR